MLCHYIAKISLNVMNNVEPQQTEFDGKYSMFSMECIFKEDPSTKNSCTGLRLNVEFSA